MAEEATQNAEEAEEARMLRAEERLPEPHEAVRQLKGKHTPDEEAYHPDLA